MYKRFITYKQIDSMDCGPTCLRMISRYYGQRYDLVKLREYCYASKNGVSLLGISDAAERIGFRSRCIKSSFEKFISNAIFPCITHWREDHFIVVIGAKVKNKKGKLQGSIYVADPAFGKLTYSVDEFLGGWINDKEDGVGKGTFMMLVPTLEFYHPDISEIESKYKLSNFFSYIKPFKKLFIQVIIGLVISMAFSFILPFLTQSMVDIGIVGNSLNYIYLVLASQLIIAVSELAISYMQGWILLHTTSRISIAIVSDFVAKMLRLPISFFESKKTGDLIQRIEDNSRIQSFMTGSLINTGLSFLSFFVFAIILAYYNITMFIIFITGHTLYVGWVLLFLKIRRELDFKYFDKASKTQSNIIEMITGAEDIKLNGCENKMRNKWESIQADLFQIGVKGLSISQIQGVGAFFLTNTTNIILSFLSAYLVINGEITLGMMMSLSYILGQLKGPVSSFIGFVHSYQDAKISLERLGEVHLQKDENIDGDISDNLVKGYNDDIILNNVSYSYMGPNTPPVLKDVSFVIKGGETTAIVGESGSGKTTLLKLLLNYFEPISGEISIGNLKMSGVDKRKWRNQCSTVMQNGYIFSGTVAENIALSESDSINKERLKRAAIIANIHDFIIEMPSGYNTKIGPEGSGISQGQRQRLLIARAIYKDSRYILFDEATNSLDANNERSIIENLNEYFSGRTAIIVAHRLSTVRNADKIVVLDKGAVVEIGTHNELIDKRGKYYNLIKNQLEL